MLPKSACLFGNRENNHRRVFIEITNVCNMYCKHCMNNSGNHLWEGLPKADMLHLISELNEQGIMHIYISGGEPLLYKGIDEVLEYAHSLGTKITLATNGLEIMNHIDTIARCVEIVSISLDGIGDTHDYFRGVPGAYEQVVKRIKALNDIGVKTKISSIIWKQNMNQLEDIVVLAKSLGTMKLNFNVLVPVGRAKNNSDILIDVKHYPEVYNTVNDLIEKYKDENFDLEIKRRHKLTEESTSCPGGDKIFHINAYGKFSPCSWISKIECDEFSQQWERGKTEECLSKCKNFNDVLVQRSSRYKITGCPALSNIYNGGYLEKDPLNSMLDVN